ncbi:carbon starvation CstA family protein [Candidatus Laterigemmans baculatus]|uniref:carbon starvation CstA family protein n=1 Tax=Candidatus Laterigemmans baculatus TaxID=2770505 RepID=UPI0013DB525F|nr:carbon starvation protein A [Candidatus Laterigemmans baculatus]
MSTLFVAALSFIGFLVAYHTYGRWLSRKLFGLRGDAAVPSHAQRDDVDFVPTRLPIIFGHHFTSIAGTGPIVGPAIAVFWGWLPALLWVVFGSILIGGVHDLAALVISLRNRGQTIGETAGRLISPRAKILFLTILALALFLVLAVFGLVIALIFDLYPESVLSVWVAMPVAIAIGLWGRQRTAGLLVPSLIGLLMLYAAVYLGAYYYPIDLADYLPRDAGIFSSPVVVWTLILLVYAFAASVLPVWLLLQPRDYINSQQLFVALALLVAGLILASVSGRADLTATTPAIATDVPSDAPPIFPFLFITVACGAVSGFHCLVSSGTSSKQVNREPDAQPVGYGAMLLEGALAVLVILACTSGVGMGPVVAVQSEAGRDYQVATAPDGTAVTGHAAWQTYYPMTAESKGWASHGLKNQLAAFIDGGANFLSTLGIPLRFAVAMMAVLVACFAATTLDTATRLQRYVLQELGATLRIRPLENKFAATTTAVGVAAAVALLAGEEPGKGGLLLWPLFGATNQLLAGLALMVAVFYLARRRKPTWPVFVPMVVMMAMPAWAIIYQMLFNWYPVARWELIGFGVALLLLQIWMAIEGLIFWKSAQGQLEPAAHPHPLDQELAESLEPASSL